MHSLDFPWRVAIDRGTAYELLAGDGTRLEATHPQSAGTRPVVGDYASADAIAHRITAIAPRRSWVARARTNGEPQLVAANVTAGFVVTSPEPREFSPRRIVRYLVALRAGNVQPAILLNKCDGDGDAGALVMELRRIAEGAPVIPISALDGTNCEALEAYLQPNATVAFCGSSGVGKSTLLNRLAEGGVMPTGAMRDDGRGRHTTSFRRLIVLRNGAAIIDTPGMRAFVPWAQAADVDDAFSEVTRLARGCRFDDCRHEREPACAVRDAVDSDRLEQWHKLRREAAWIETRSDALAAAQRKRRWKQIHVEARRQRRASEDC